MSLKQTTLVVILVIALNSGFCYCEESHVTLYEEAFHKGSSLYMHFSECENVPNWLNDVPASLNTHGSCVAICEHAFCEGRCVPMFPGSLGHFNLSEIQMEKFITSVKPCDINTIKTK